MINPRDPQVTQLADEIVEMYRRVYAFDLDLDKASATLQREPKARGVSRETYKAAKVLGRPRTVELFLDYIERLNEAAWERLQHLDERGDT